MYVIDCYVEMFVIAGVLSAVICHGLCFIFVFILIHFVLKKMKKIIFFCFLSGSILYFCLFWFKRFLSGIYESRKALKRVMLKSFLKQPFFAVLWTFCLLSSLMRRLLLITRGRNVLSA